MIDDQLKEAEKKMNVSIDHLHQDLAKVRTGRASLSILDEVRVDYYGNPTPLNQVANLGIPDSQTITIQPWDANLVKDISKAIQSSNLGLTPADDGKVVRLAIPPLTTERRKEMVKTVKRYAEDSKVAIRNIRRDFNDKIKQLEKDHSISEDELKHGQDDIQKVTDKFVAEIDKISQIKEKDLMES